ncbi:Tripartite ATP-independent transporter DctM subunit OS=Castellaniella defragrans OX=75697 GN=HNR28_001847 PE=4 SV=1 [Castellaniella defragrans]
MRRLRYGDKARHARVHDAMASIFSQTQDASPPAGDREADPAPHTTDFALHHGWARVLDRFVGRSAESVAVALVVVEVAILSCGVFWRFVLGHALVWSDEVASNLFLWIVMLGSVGAYQRGEHMRLTVVIRKLSPTHAEICNTLNTAFVALFSLALLLALIWPAALPVDSSLTRLLHSISTLEFFSGNYLGQEYFTFTPVLRLPVLYVLLGIIVGQMLILILAVLRLINGRAKVVLPTLAAVFIGLSALYLARDQVELLGSLNLILFFVIFLGGLILIGTPIAFSFGAVTLGYLATVTSAPLSVVAGQMQDGMTNLILLSVPLFILLGFLMESVGIARRLVEAVAAFVGHLRGGLNVVLVFAMFLVSGISGSKMADMAAVTPVLFPEMERRGYRRSEMLALLSSSGAMADLIPPAINLIVIGTVCNLSIKSLFIGGLLPAFIAAILLVVVAVLRSGGTAVQSAAPMRWSARASVVLVAAPGLILPVIIRFFVTEGVATATEVSTVGIMYTLIVGIFIYREFNWRHLYPMIRETVNLTGAIMLIIAIATSMSWALTQSGFATTLAQVLNDAPGGKFGFLALSSVLFIVLGMLLEGIPVIVLFGPLLFPVASELGVNDIHYAIVVILAMSIGLFAPPFGVGYYSACAIGKCDPDKAARAIVPYLGALIAALVLITVFPWLSTGFL